MPRQRRPVRSWGYEVPRLIGVTGYRDQEARITYIPWSDVQLGAVGWEVWPDRNEQNVLVYIIPTSEKGVMEIRCHMSTQEFPDPDSDELLGKFVIPTERFNEE